MLDNQTFPQGKNAFPGILPTKNHDMEVLVMRMLDRIALAVLVIGGLNWGGVGLFGLDLVAALFGGSASILSRVVYVLVSLSALWCITLFFREETQRDSAHGTA